MITREEFEDCLREMGSNCDKIADAGAAVGLLAKQEKTIIAELKNLSDEKSNAGKEDYAFTHSRYKDHIEKWQKARRDELYYDARQEYLNKKFEAYRTDRADVRALTKGL